MGGRNRRRGLFALIWVFAEVWLAYRRYVRLLKGLTFSLFACVALLFVVQVPWRQALAGRSGPRSAPGRGRWRRGRSTARSPARRWREPGPCFHR